MEQVLRIREAQGDEPGVAYALQRLAYFFGNLGELERAAQLCEESVALARVCNDPLPLAFALRTAGHVAWRLRQFEQSLAYSEESLALTGHRLASLYGAHARWGGPSIV